MLRRNAAAQHGKGRSDTELDAPADRPEEQLARWCPGFAGGSVHRATAGLPTRTQEPALCDVEHAVPAIPEIPLFLNAAPVDLTLHACGPQPIGLRHAIVNAVLARLTVTAQLLTTQ